MEYGVGDVRSLLFPVVSRCLLDPVYNATRCKLYDRTTVQTVSGRLAGWQETDRQETD